MTALGISLWLFAGVVAAGAALGARMLIDEHWPAWAKRLGIAHGLCAAVATTLACLSLRGPARGVHEGAASFGAIAAALLLTALAIGTTIYVIHRRRGASPVLVAIHASIGVAGAVILAAWWSMPPA